MSRPLPQIQVRFKRRLTPTGRLEKRTLTHCSKKSTALGSLVTAGGNKVVGYEPDRSVPVVFSQWSIVVAWCYSESARAGFIKAVRLYAGVTNENGIGYRRTGL
jgi:hypothetical protein